MKTNIPSKLLVEFNGIFLSGKDIRSLNFYAISYVNNFLVR